jgi:hypothetical protein
MKLLMVEDSAVMAKSLELTPFRRNHAVER